MSAILMLTDETEKGVESVLEKYRSDIETRF